ncbi:MAG: AurF N-oxygenase family protein [Acidimicrobiales bacterium]
MDTALDPAFDALVRRLSRQSVERHFDAFADVDWDADGVDPSDQRWSMERLDPLASTEWYRGQPPEARSRIGLHRIATAMRTGWEFENILQRGLLAYAFWLPNRRPEFRYLYHEVAEESHHTMMFQELVDRSGLDVRGLAPALKAVAELGVIPLARLFPPLFFLFVLGGEEPIDHVQHRWLRAGIAHPLLERIVRIHVTEEARHLSFARHYLEREVPRLGPARRRLLSLAAPLLLGVMARQMLSTSRYFARTNGIPRHVVTAARRSDEGRALVCGSVAKVRRLCRALGLVDPVAAALWRAMRIWGDDAAAGAG